MATSTVINEQMIIDQTNSSTYTDINKDDQEDSCNLIGSSSSFKHLEFLRQQQQTSNDDKLPLKQPWSTYFYKADKQRDWKQNVIYITSIHYVEDFWSFYTHTYGLRDLTNGTDYMIFKFGCLPMWEDVSSRGGGKWLLTIDPKRRRHELDGYWLHLMLLLIGEQFDSEFSHYINGAVVSLRSKADRLAIWLKKIDNIETIKKIGTNLRDLLNWPSTMSIVFEYHETKFDEHNNEIRLCL